MSNQSRLRLPLCALLLIVALLLNTAPLRSQMSTAGTFDRTGMTIDTEERIYFGLFPDLADFQEARFRYAGDGGVEITVVRSGNRSDSVITISSSAARQLHIWFDELEEIYNGERTVDFAVLPRIVRPSAPFQTQRPVELTTKSGERYIGEILLAGDSAVVLWPPDVPYRWRSADSIAIPFPVSSIRQISRREDFYYGIGAGLLAGGFASMFVQSSTEGDSPELGLLALVIPALAGGYIGNGFGVSAGIDGDRARYQESQSQLASRARFYAGPPPEIRRLLDRSSAPGYRLPATLPSLRHPSQIDPPPLFHIGVGIGTAGGSVHAPYRLYTSSPSELLLPIVPERAVFLEAAYSVVERIQIGAGYLMMGGTSQAEEDNREYLDLSLIQFFTDFVTLAPSNRSMPGVEVAVGATALVSQTTARGHLTSPFAGSTADSNYSISTSGFGFGMRVRVGYHLFKFLSIELGVQQLQVAAGEVPEVRLQGSSGTVRRAEPHEVDVSSINARLGVRVHF